MATTDVQCSGCGKFFEYGEEYLVIEYNHVRGFDEDNKDRDMEEHDERVAQFCKKCSSLVLLTVHRQTGINKPI